MKPEEARLQHALDYIYSFIDYETQPKFRNAINYDLRRMDELLAGLGNPHLGTKTVHVAGTKGKGSVAAMVTSVLTAAGYKAGLFTSPHLHIFNERIRIGEKLISDEEIIELVDRLRPMVTEVNRKASYGVLTTFEIITVMGFAHFKDHKTDYQVIEVGLGGRLDATNVVQPDVCVITSISLDHTDVLGDTLAQIAAEKAGIIKPGAIVISSPQKEEAGKVIDEVCRKAGVKLIKAGRDVTWQPGVHEEGLQSFTVKGRKGEYSLSIPLLGSYQMENAAVAVAALETLAEKDPRITSDAISRGLAGVKWPGRLQVLNRHPLVVADGAHNPYSAGKLREALKEYFSFENGILIIGASADKDISGMAAELAPLFNQVIITRSTHPRAAAIEPLLAGFRSHGVEARVMKDISAALPAALAAAGGNDLICVTGSLFVAAGAIEQAKELGLKA